MGDEVRVISGEPLGRLLVGLGQRGHKLLSFGCYLSPDKFGLFGGVPLGNDVFLYVPVEGLQFFKTLSEALVSILYAAMRVRPVEPFPLPAGQRIPDGLGTQFINKLLSRLRCRW